MNNMTPFYKAWEILKYFKNPHDEEAGVNPSFKEKYPNYDLRNLFANPRNQPTEEETYGGISHREHPLHNVEQEREMAEMDDPRMANMPDDVLMETPRDRRLTETPFNPFRGVNPFAEREMAEVDEAMEDEKEAAKVGDVGRPRTIPMSPRGSVRGQGERQAFDKPKKPDWWRTLTGEE